MSKQALSTSTVPIVTIDGPSGAGKGTLCRLVAENTGFHLLDSGALYRLTALDAMLQSVDLSDPAAAAKVAENLDVRFSAARDGTLIMLGARDVTSEIRSEEVGMNASVVAAYPEVRAALLARQRAFAEQPGLVADGRDMGTVVFPSAPVKIFLTASAEERAKRRVLQLQAAGGAADFEQILADIRARDDRDTNRSTAPLKPAPDAVVLDSTGMPIQDVLQAILRLVASKFPPESINR